ncbi:ABC transporter substrate-binding protein [Roseateles violae]|uniref:Sugar ABC transporter substrate-binding protein n=1 Tax=Roseateles violae TaxID=3058042 RepID=A0ABT8DVC1_9BURK|nr:sugar ABC transporter substrate-binding protein [Pelomonas sp. PFR6]MDN3920327.1 sugar ABC transporter substrate-binding protein [Pelomonas sp. PFR6]
MPSPDSARRRLLQALSASLLPAAKPLWAARAEQRLEFWTMQLSPHLDAYVNELIAGFQARHPGVTVKWVDLPWAETERKLLSAIAAGGSPDVVNLNPQFSAKLAEFGALADPEQYLGADERADYLPAAWNANRLDGRCFALPWYLSTNLTLVNQRLLGGADIPASHQQLLAAAPVIKRGSGAFAYFPALDGSSPLETLVAMGAELLSPGGCGAGFINVEGQRVFDFYRRLYAEGLTPRNVVSEGHRKAVEMFLSGQVAVVSSGMQFLSYIRNANRDVYREIEAAPQLHAPGRKPGIAAMNLVVPEASPNKELAFRFARFVTAPLQQLEFARRVPILPSTRASYADPLFAAPDSSDLLGRARALSARHVLDGEVQVPPLRNYNKLRSNYARNLQAVMLGRRPRDEALADIGRQWGQLLGCKR